jgi:hypothetical protein
MLESAMPRLFVLALVWLSVNLGAGETLGQFTPNGPRLCDTWLISTRNLPHDCFSEDAARRMRFYRLSESGTQWERSDRHEFLASDDPTIPTSYFVHGNWFTHQDAIDLGLDFARNMRRQSGNRPLRVVIWSWQSERELWRIRSDLELKLKRADTQGIYLGWLMNQSQRTMPISLVGYSYGARVVSVALHLLGGGQFSGQQLSPPPHRTEGRVSAVFLAGAEPIQRLLPGQPLGFAPYVADQIVVTTNERDPVLCYFRLLEPNADLYALGESGFDARRLGPNAHKVWQVPVDSSIGRSHSLIDYVASAPVMRMVAPYAYADPMYRGELVVDQTITDRPLSSLSQSPTEATDVRQFAGTSAVRERSEGNSPNVGR